jgi:hypothetical protein
MPLLYAKTSRRLRGLSPVPFVGRRDDLVRPGLRQVVIACLCVLILLIGMALFSSAASRRKTPAQQNNSSQAKKDLNQRRLEMDARVPTTEYDAPEPTNAEEKAKRWKKNKHYDDGGMVMKNPGEGTGSALESHAFFALPALPAAQSDVILTADVLKSEAHLSNDKTGVYSEFNVQVGEVLKNTGPTLSQGSLIVLSRRGGKVRYASGRVFQYEIMFQYMPAVGGRYVFFLKAIPDTDDYEFLTGYEIESGHVQPLDGGPQFDAFRGKEVTRFINIVRDAIAKN